MTTCSRAAAFLALAAVGAVASPALVQFLRHVATSGTGTWSILGATSLLAILSSIALVLAVRAFRGSARSTRH